MTEENGLYTGVYIAEDPLDEINLLYSVITLFSFLAFKPHSVYLWAKYSTLLCRVSELILTVTALSSKKSPTAAFCIVVWVFSWYI